MDYETEVASAVADELLELAADSEAGQVFQRFDFGRREAGEAVVRLCIDLKKLAPQIAE